MGSGWPRDWGSPQELGLAPVHQALESALDSATDSELASQLDWATEKVSEPALGFPPVPCSAVS